MGRHWTVVINLWCDLPYVANLIKRIFKWRLQYLLSQSVQDDNKLQHDRSRYMRKEQAYDTTIEQSQLSGMSKSFTIPPTLQHIWVESTSKSNTVLSSDSEYIIALTIIGHLCTNVRTDHCQVHKLSFDGNIKSKQHVAELHCSADRLTKPKSPSRLNHHQSSDLNGFRRGLTSTLYC